MLAVGCSSYSRVLYYNRFNACKSCMHTLAEAFELISSTRHAERSFSEKPINLSTMQKVIELTQHAPSSFNLQPYKIILIQSEDCKDLVSTAMNPGNDRHVRKAAYTAIFAADKDPARNTRQLMDLETANGASASYVSSLPAKITLLLGKGFISNRIRALGSHLLSPLKPSPIIRPTNEVWAVKNTSFAAMQFMLAATSYGLRTLPMEGFDERRLAAILDVPLEDYSIPVVICVGHSDNPDDPLPLLATPTANVDTATMYNTTSTSNILKPKEKVRFPASDICYIDRFGQQSTDFTV